MKKSLFSLLLFAFFVAPTFAFAAPQTSPIGEQANSTCVSEGQICPTGTCRAIPEWKEEDGGSGFYCAPAGTPGVTSPAAGGGDTSIQSIQRNSPQSSGGVNDRYLRYYRDAIIWTVNTILLPVVIALAFLIFIWGVYKYFILGATSEDKRAEGRQLVLWGVIGFVIIFTVWGLVNIVTATLGLRAGGSSPEIPTIGTQGSKSGTVPTSRGSGSGSGAGGSSGGGSGIGCKDRYALNYDPNATGYAGCEYPCGDPKATTYGKSSVCEYEGGEAEPTTPSSDEDEQQLEPGQVAI